MTALAETPIRVSRRVYERLTDLKVRRESELQRQVTYNEIIEMLLEVRVAEMYRATMGRP
jgi:hypothetical protein